MPDNSLWMIYLATVATTFVSALGQISLKKGAMTSAGQAPLKKFMNVWTLGGIALILAGTFLLTLLMRRAYLSHILPISAITHIFVPLGSWLWLGEKLTPKFCFGIGFIVIGIAVIVT